MNNLSNGLYYCNNEKLDTMNKNIFNRNLSSHPLHNEYFSRPSFTRRVLFPAVDCHTPAKTDCNSSNTIYSQHEIFNPGENAPFSGWASSIDDDSKLKNIFMTNQKWCDQTIYIPPSSSSLYTTNKQKTFTDQSRIIQQKETIQEQHPFLFRNDTLVCKHSQSKPASYSRYKDEFGNSLFHNHTRQQMREIPMSAMNFCK